MSQAISTIVNIIREVNPFVGLLIIFFLGMYLFWKESSRSRKNNSSVFDAFILSILLGIVIGRAMFVILNWTEFSQYIWYWLPYERYGNEIFMFRLLPWRFLRIWDGQLDILFTFVGVLFSQSVIVLFLKKWKWADMFSAQYLTNWMMVGLIYVFVGIQSSNDEWIKHGWWILIPFILFLILQKFLVQISLGRKKESVRFILHNIFALVAVIIISYVYFTSSPKIPTLIGIASLVVWYLMGIFMNISEHKKADNVTIERVSSVRQVSLPSIRKPIRLPR